MALEQTVRKPKPEATTAASAAAMKPPLETAEDKLARLERENAALKAEVAARPMGGVFRMKISEKGGLSVYGLGRFPVTLYKEQWIRLLDHADEVRKELNDPANKFSTKPLGK